MGKRIKQLKTKIEQKPYPIDEALKKVIDSSNAKFDESVEVHINLGIDPKKTDQNVRGIALLPEGTGKTKKICVIAKGEKFKEAKDSGADYYGETEIVDKILKGWMDFDVLIATPDSMREVSKLGKILGPKGLMPNPKTGTVTFEIKKTVDEIKKGRVEFKNDSFGIVHTSIGKKSFGIERLKNNLNAFVNSVIKSKPPTSKGAYIKKISICSTMGPSVEIDVKSFFTE